MAVISPRHFLLGNPLGKNGLQTSFAYSCKQALGIFVCRDDPGRGCAESDETRQIAYGIVAIHLS